MANVEDPVDKLVLEIVQRHLDELGFEEKVRELARDIDQNIEELEREQRQNRRLLDAIVEERGSPRPHEQPEVIVIDDDDDEEQEQEQEQEQTSVVEEEEEENKPVPCSEELTTPTPSAAAVDPPSESPLPVQLPLVKQQQFVFTEQNFEEAEIPAEPFREFVAKKTVDTWWSTGTFLQIALNKNRQQAFRLQFSTGEKSLVLPHFLADINHPRENELQIQTRVVGLYLKWEKLFSGYVAELPSSSNNYRYLIFYDDGFAQYLKRENLHRIYIQDDSFQQVTSHSRAFIKDYFEAFPYRPLLQVKVGDEVMTEWRGTWSLATVHVLDGSLMQMRFSSQRLEWIYRGSPRLEPINGMMDKIASFRAKNSALTYKEVLQRFPFPTTHAKFQVQCMSMNSSDPEPPPPPRPPSPPPPSTPPTLVTKETTPLQNPEEDDGEWKPPWIEMRRGTGRGIGRRGGGGGGGGGVGKRGKRGRRGRGKDVASLLLKKLKDDESSDEVDERNPVSTTRRTWNYLSKQSAATYIAHLCSPACCPVDSRATPLSSGFINYLAAPLTRGFEREVIKRIYPSRTDVYYRAPCSRRLRSISDVAVYLKSIESTDLFTDQFCFDPNVSLVTRAAKKSGYSAVFVDDISNGEEPVPISCLNEIDDDLPIGFEYKSSRFWRNDETFVPFTSDPNFLVCCDCEDDCEDKSKCACSQLSRESALALGGKDKLQDVGFSYKRLASTRKPKSAIYECNSKCKCNSQCGNRVLQNGIRLRLQVFKTVNRGWGVRCIDDIPKGAFVCTYSGRLMTEEQANKDGYRYGDEYLAELDHIEVIEKLKEGYESDVSEDLPSSSTASPISMATHDVEEEDEDQSKKDKKWSISRLPRGIAFKSTSYRRSVDLFKPKSANKTRLLFGKTERGCYAVDAKSAGNVGRFLNHSCSPNLCVQNVFVDTHDLRFPYVAFFAKRPIRAKAELTWDYSYEVGSVPGKVIKCHCNSSVCRGRLL